MGIYKTLKFSQMASKRALKRRRAKERRKLLLAQQKAITANLKRAELKSEKDKPKNSKIRIEGESKLKIEEAEKTFEEDGKIKTPSHEKTEMEEIREIEYISKLPIRKRRKF